MTVELRDAYRNVTVLDNLDASLGTATATTVDANFQLKAGFGIGLSVDPVTNKVTIVNTGPGAGALTTILDQNANDTYYPIFTRAPGPGDVNPITSTYQMDTMYLDQTTTPLTYNPGTATLTVANIYAPTITGHPTIEGITSTGATGSGKFVFDFLPNINTPTITGHPTVEGVTSTGATGTGKFVFDATPTISNLIMTGHPTVEGVTSIGATGTGAFVFDSSPTLITPTLGVATVTSINKMMVIAPAVGSTISIADGKIFTVNHTLTFNGTDNTTFTFPYNNGTLALNDQQFYIGTTQIAINRSTASQTLTGVSIDGNAATVTNGVYSNLIYNNPTWIGSLLVSQGGTGADNTADALNNLLPSGEISGYILKTSGPGSYFWAAETGASTIIGTQINTSRVTYTATANQVLFTGTGSYTIGAGQLRVYIDGVRQFPSEYTETSTTSFTLNVGVPEGTKVLAEVDSSVNYGVAANAVTFSSTAGVSATNVQTAIEELDTEKAPLANPTFSGVVTISNTIQLKEVRETVYTGLATSGTITPDAANGSIQTITLTGSITLNALNNPQSGQTVTLIVKQPAAGGPYTLTSSMLFANGSKTLSTTANAIDMISVSYVGGSYYASLVKGFA